jgi:hypothetical protein
VPLTVDTVSTRERAPASAAATQLAEQGNWPLFFSYVGFSLVLDALLLVSMMWLFNTRWRVAG